VVLLLSACGEQETRSLCPAYESFLATRDEITAIDPSEATAAEVTELAEDYLQQVVRMQEVADGRYTAELDALESATDDVVRTLAAVQDDAEYETWQPLIEDSLEDVRNASARFEEAIEPTCAPAATVTSTESSEP
jgi:hypothetical protein